MTTLVELPATEPSASGPQQVKPSRASTDRPTSSQPPRPGSRKRKHRILWVDDDPSIVAASTRRLRRKGIQVLPASDGMQGYWQALTLKPDLIVTDLRMPRWEGGELIDCLRTNVETKSIPLVVLSGYLDKELRKRLYALGVASVLEKPVESARLTKTLRRLLADK